MARWLNLVLLVSALIFIEGGAYMLKEVIFSGSRETQDVKGVEDVRELTRSFFDSSAQAIHPYLGYVYSPDVWQSGHAGVPVSDFGFASQQRVIQKRSGAKLLVGIFGGSVAWWLQHSGGEVLARELKKHPAYSEREVVLLPIALGGYKQPQQALALTYLASIGAEFDIVVNLDGYNEVVLTPGNSAENVYAFYPFNWRKWTRLIADDEVQSLFGKQSLLRGFEYKGRRFIENSWMGKSASVQLIWECIEKILRQKQNDFGRRLDKQKFNQHLPYGTSGPRERPGDLKSLYPQIVNVWVDSSLVMKRLSEASGARYFHFLQPNQYVPNSKPFSAEELDKAYREDHPMKLHILDAYPLLRAAGGHLQDLGVNFKDLTNIFSQEKSSVYQDDCCHLNPYGNRLLAKQIGIEIVKQLSD